MLGSQNNLACTYQFLGRLEESHALYREIHSKSVKLYGEEHEETLVAANNYVDSFGALGQIEEAKALLRKIMPSTLRVRGECHDTTLRMRWRYGQLLYLDPSATLDDLREAVTTLEDTERTARRVLGGAHPVTSRIETALRNARAALRAREAPEP